MERAHIHARYAHGQGVAAYLARYLKGGPLKNSQLLPAGGGCVRFRYRPHRDGGDGAGESVVLDLVPEAFLARFNRTPAAASCARCGARLHFVPLLAHGPAPPPPTLH